MPYVTQTFSAGQVFTAAQANQVQTNLNLVRTSHISSAAPAELANGVMWLDTSPASASGYWDLKTFAGSSWIKEGRFYPNSNHFVPYRANSLLGTAAVRDVGTSVGDLVVLSTVSGNAALPALDGSQLFGRYAPLTGNGLQTLPSSAVVSINPNNGEVIRLLHSVAIGSLVITSPSTVQELFILREALTSRAQGLVWPTSINWKNGTAPTLSDGVGTIDLVRLLTNNAGTSWFGDYITNASVGLGTYAFAWGNNNNGQVGDNSTTNRTAPTQIGSSTASWTKLIFGGYVTNVNCLTGFSFGISGDNLLYGWGTNSFYELGLGDTTRRTIPTAIGSATWREISAGQATDQTTGSLVVGVKLDGTLWAWGTWRGPGAGGDDALMTAPTQVGTLANWRQVVVGALATTALFDDVWATNSAGQVFRITHVGTTSTLVTTLSAVVAPGSTQVFAQQVAINGFTGQTTRLWITTSGTLFGYGENAKGQLGQNTTTDITDPVSAVQIGSGQTWTKIAISVNQHVFAIDANQDLYAWGNGESGALATGTSSDQFLPTRVGCGISWADVALGYRFTLALDVDGRLYGAGAGFDGYSLTGATGSSLSQIGSLTTWRTLAAGPTTAGATRD